MSQMSGKKLYVGNLSYEVTEEDLQEVFEKISRGIKKINLITERGVEGRAKSKGYAFIEYEANEGAEAALKAFQADPALLNLKGRVMKVNYAEERERDRGSSGSGGGAARRAPSPYRQRNDYGGGGRGDRGFGSSGDYNRGNRSGSDYDNEGGN